MGRFDLSKGDRFDLKKSEGLSKLEVVLGWASGADLDASAFSFFALFCIRAAAAVLAAIDVPSRLIACLCGVLTAAAMFQFSPIRAGITVAFCIIEHVICKKWVILVFLCLFFVIGPVLDAAFTAVLFQVFVVLFTAVA